MKFKKPTKAIITDAGFASRYLPISKTVPKAMLPLGSRPIMQLVVEECVAAGINHIIIVATPEGKPIYEDYFNNSVNRIRKQLTAQGKQDRYSEVQQVLDFPKITIIEQDPALPYGNGSPIMSARDYISDNEAFLAFYSDDVIFGSSDAVSLVKAFEAHPDAYAVIMGQEVAPSEVDKYGIIELKEDSQLDHIVEKPKRGTEPSTLASYGRYLLTPKVFEYLDPENVGLDKELWTVDAITKIAEEYPVYVQKTEGEWMTTGDPQNYFLAHLKYVLDYEDYADAVREYVKQH